MRQLLALLIIISALPAYSQKKKTDTAPPATIDSVYLANLTWRNIGPFRGGRSCAVTGVPGKANLFYFGSTGGGVWRTTDAGNTWENISDGWFGGSIGAVTVSESDPNVIYVGQGEETVRGNTSGGYGVWKSVDAGRTWEHKGLTDTRHISRIRIHPQNPEIAFVAAMGDLFKDSEERGLFKTTDGGTTWSKVLFADQGSGCIDVTFDPANPRILYASTWTFRRTPYSFSSGGPGSKLWKSTDNGESWQEISTKPGFPSGILGIIGIAVSPANPDRVWAMVENEPDGGLYRSDDGGLSWTKFNDQRDLRQRAWYYTRVYADPKDAEKVYVLNVGYHTSKDGGKTFKERYTHHGDHHDLWIDPTEPERMIMGDDGGAMISFDGGDNWTTYHNQPTAQFYRVTTDDHFPFRIYGAQQDNSSIRIDHRSDEAYITEDNWEETAGGESGHHAIYPGNNDIVLGGSYGGFMMRLNHETNEIQMTNVWPDNPLGHGVDDMKYRFQWNFPLFFSRHFPERLYALSNHVHISGDLGQSWTTVSPDLTTNDLSKQGPSGGPITKDNTSVEYYCTIFAAAESVTDSQVFWTGSDDGKIHVTRDGAKTWQDITPSSMPPFTQINSIEADPFHPGGLYVAATRYKWGDYAPYLYYTPDFGASWKRIDSGIPRNHFTRVIRSDQEKEGLLYAGTENGMYISFNNGQSWQRFQQNLPIVPITDLAVKDRHLIAATQGRAFWMIDDLSPLYEVEQLKDRSIHMFTPKPTWLMQAGYGGTSKTAGENHPDGAILNYYIATMDTSRTYTIEITTESGVSVRLFSSKAKDKADLWEPKQGSNRFIWDMRTTGPDKIEGVIQWFVLNKGPFVLPGEYSIYLSDGYNTHSVPLFLLADPRCSATMEERRAQYDFIIRGRDKMMEMNKVIREIRNAVQQMNDLMVKTENESLKDELRHRIELAQAIEKNLYQTQNKSPQDPLNYPIRLNNKYGHVIALASLGFAHPTQSMYAVMEELEGKINVEIEKWKELKVKLEEINQRAIDLKVPMIKLD